MSGFFVFRESKKLQDWHDVTATSEDKGVELDVSRAGSQQYCSAIMNKKALYRESAFTTHKRNASSGWAPDFMACSVSRKAISALLNSPEENFRA